MSPVGSVGDRGAPDEDDDDDDDDDNIDLRSLSSSPSPNSDASKKLSPLAYRRKYLVTGVGDDVLIGLVY